MRKLQGPYMCVTFLCCEIKQGTGKKGPPFVCWSPPAEVKSEPCLPSKVIVMCKWANVCEMLKINTYICWWLYTYA